MARQHSSQLTYSMPLFPTSPSDNMQTIALSIQWLFSLIAQCFSDYHQRQYGTVQFTCKCCMYKTTLCFLLASENISNIKTDTGGKHVKALCLVQPSITQFCVQQQEQTPACAAPTLHRPVRQALIMKDTARERRGKRGREGAREREHIWDRWSNYSIIWSLVISWHSLCVYGNIS